MNKRYVVDEDGERVAVLLEIDDYERLLAQHRAPTGVMSCRSTTKSSTPRRLSAASRSS